VLSQSGGASAMTGFTFSSGTASLERTVVLAISHSGQTFPTLHATHALRNLCGDRVFVMTGSIDSKLSGAIGQEVHATARWQSRVFTTSAGWRTSEALTLSTVACHHTLTELLAYLSAKAQLSQSFRTASGTRFGRDDVADVKRQLTSFVKSAASSIVGVDEHGQRLAKREVPVHNALRREGYRWGLHVLDGPISWVLSALYIGVTVISGVDPIITAIVKSFEPNPSPSALRAAIVFDAVVYMFLPLLWTTILRILTGRQIFARLGKRTIVIGDVPWVHQLLEAYVSKLFALSYSIASVDVHGANAVDHFVHRCTHRVTRGVLLAMGRPDGRLVSHARSESWVLMGIRQAKAIINLGAGPEVITVGHNPYRAKDLLDGHVCLETHRPKFLCEALIGAKSNEPMQRMASVKAITSTGAQTDRSFFDQRIFMTEPIGTHLLPKSQRSLVNSAVKEKIHRVSLSSLAGTPHALKELNSSPIDRHSAAGARAFGFGSADTRTELSKVLNTISSDDADGENFMNEASTPNVKNALEMDRALNSMSTTMHDVVMGSAHMELFWEARFASLERYIAFLVLFHRMASTVASFWPLNFDLSRSQSQLRIATTAAPISAAEVEREWSNPLDIHTDFDAFDSMGSHLGGLSDSFAGSMRSHNADGSSYAESKQYNQHSPRSSFELSILDQSMHDSSVRSSPRQSFTDLDAPAPAPGSRNIALPTIKSAGGLSQMAGSTPSEEGSSRHGSDAAITLLMDQNRSAIELLQQRRDSGSSAFKVFDSPVAILGEDENSLRGSTVAVRSLDTTPPPPAEGIRRGSLDSPRSQREQNVVRQHRRNSAAPPIDVDGASISDHSTFSTPTALSPLSFRTSERRRSTFGRGQVHNLEDLSGGRRADDLRRAAATASAAVATRLRASSGAAENEMRPRAHTTGAVETPARASTEAAETPARASTRVSAQAAEANGEEHFTNSSPT